MEDPNILLVSEMTFAQVAKTLEEERSRLNEIRKSLERCEQDTFTHTPLVRMYKRPPIAPSDF